MANSCEQMASRRAFMGGAASLTVVGMSSGIAGCASIPGFGLTEAIQRLLQVSSERAFARMIGDGGFWDSQVGALGIEQFLGLGSNSTTGLLRSKVFKERLGKAFAGVAEKGAERAAPLVAESVRNIRIIDAAEIVRGGPTAATFKLRGAMRGGLVQAMVPELGSAMRAASDPVVGQLVIALTGADVGGIAQNVAGSVNTAIWREIGVEEAAIRANPRATNDPVLIGVFGAGAIL